MVVLDLLFVRIGNELKVTHVILSAWGSSK